MKKRLVSLLLALALLVLPVVPLFPAPGEPTIGIMSAVIALAVLCSGIALTLLVPMARSAANR